MKIDNLYKKCYIINTLFGVAGLAASVAFYRKLWKEFGWSTTNEYRSYDIR